MMAYPVIQLPKVSKQFLTVLKTFCVCACLLAVALHPISASANAKKRAVYEKMRQLEEATRRHPNGKEPLVKLYGKPVGNNPALMAQIKLIEQYGQYYFEDYSFENDDPPSIPQIQFYKLEVTNTINSRIEALTHGITALLPPEYDLYGYEIRRYMADVGSSKVFSSRKHLKEAVLNVKRAQYVMEQWQKVLYEEMSALDALIDDPANKVDGSTRTNFRFAKAKVNAFIIEMSSWLDNNQHMLELIYQNPRSYRYYYPTFDFEDEYLMEEFLSLFRAKQKSLQNVHKYGPFREMIY